MIETNEKTIIEVNGIKLEIDLRHAKKVEQYRVGDKIKVLKKKYSDSYESYFGVIAGFDGFKDRPTIIIAYIETSYNGVNLHFAYINNESKDIDIAPAQDFDLSYEKGEIVGKFDAEVEKKQIEIKDIERKKKYFLDMFGRHFE